MPDVTRATGGKGWRYKPANTAADLSVEARKAGRQAMDAFLLSPQMQEPVLDATEDIADAARALTISSGTIDTGDFLESFDTKVGAPILIAGNLRVSGRVENDSDHAAALEFGNKKVGPGRRILGNSGQRWNTEKRPL